MKNETDVTYHFILLKAFWGAALPICLLIVLWWSNSIVGTAVTLFFIVYLLFILGIGIDLVSADIRQRFDTIQCRLDDIEERIRGIEYKIEYK